MHAIETLRHEGNRKHLDFNPQCSIIKNSPDQKTDAAAWEQGSAMQITHSIVRTVLFASLMSQFLVAGDFQLVSVPDPTQVPPSGGSGDSSCPIISPDGSFIVFASSANNLVRTTNNAGTASHLPAPLNVYLRNRTNGVTTLVSVNLSNNAGGSADSLPIDISPDGRFVLFESSANDLVPNDTNNAADVFLRDVINSTTTLVSINTNGVPGNGASRSSVMTPDGRYVAFVSSANDLTPGDTNQIADVFMRDLQSGITTLISVGATSTNPIIPLGSSEAPEITPDGRYVIFCSTAANLVSGVPAGGDVYVRDLVSNTTTWASVDARSLVVSILGLSNTTSINHGISSNGQYVVYEAGESSSTYALLLRYNLVSGSTDLIYTNAAVTAANSDMTPDGRFIAFVANTNGNSGENTCICIWDAQSASITVASADLNGNVSNNALCDWPSITPNGRWIAFLSSGTNLTPLMPDGNYHLYVRDVQNQTTTLLDLDTNGTGSAIGSGTVPRLTPDAHFAAFECADSSLVFNDRNRGVDVFVRDLVTASTELVSSHDPFLSPLSPNGPSTVSSSGMSADGRFIVFSSDADNVVPNDTNRCRDVFLRDFAGTVPLLVSANTNGLSADGPSFEPVMSADGELVAFTSSADDLVQGDTNAAQDVFIRNLQNGITSLVSVNTNGTGPGLKDSYSPTLSLDGRYVLFRSLAPNLASGSFSGENLFLRDLLIRRTFALTTGGVVIAAMSDDASAVGFIGRIAGSSATNFYVWTTQAQSLTYTNTLDPLNSYRTLVASHDGRYFAIGSSSSGAMGCRLYLADRQGGAWVLIDSVTAGVYPGLRFSRDGTMLAYTKSFMSTNQLCLCDVTTAKISVLVESLAPPGMPYGGANALDISPDGRFIVYRSPGTNNVSVPDGNIGQLYLYDRQQGANTLLTSNSKGVASDGLVAAPTFSADGQTLIFQTPDSDLIPFDFNHGSDVLARSFFYLTISSSPSGSPRISWPAIPGNNYRVQYSDKIPEGTWQDLNATVTNFGNKAWLLDSSPAQVHKFYRVHTF